MDGARTHIPPPARGFTLIEISIVVAIVLTLLTLGLSFVTAQLSSAAYSITKQRQAAIKDALIAYLGARKRLPCPIDPKTESITGKASPPALSGPACPQLGVVPYIDLGLSREIAQDGWGNLFSYRIYSVNCLTDLTEWDWGRYECFGEGKDDPNRNTLQIIDATTTINAIAIVVSHGANGLGAWAVQGTQGTPNAPPPETSEACQEAYNARNAANANVTPSSSCPPAGNFTFYKGERQDNDDVVAYLTASETLQTLARQGTIKSAIAKVNEDLQILADMALGVKRAGITIAIPSPCGGPSEPSCNPAPTAGCNTPINPVPPATTDPIKTFQTKLVSMRDPWGNSYVVNDSVSGVAGKLPICIYSQGNGSGTCVPDNSCNPTSPAICKSIDKASFDSYLAKAGSSGCPW